MRRLTPIDFPTPPKPYRLKLTEDSQHLTDREMICSWVFWARIRLIYIFFWFSTIFPYFSVFVLWTYTCDFWLSFELHVFWTLFLLVSFCFAYFSFCTIASHWYVWSSGSSYQFVGIFFHATRASHYCDAATGQLFAWTSRWSISFISIVSYVLFTCIGSNLLIFDRGTGILSDLGSPLPHVVTLFRYIFVCFDFISYRS